VIFSSPIFFSIIHHPLAGGKCVSVFHSRAHCDAAAQWIYTFLGIKGLNIPEDVSIISFDNTLLCNNLAPKLTSSGANKEYYAKKAFSAMIACINNPNKSQQVQVKTELHERESVKTLI
ncbi:MAG: substrate-binding domain-containing protein, partial [Bacilli bacterium]|nr:substrate-binding domain-containing protein [Bacilli bacterium]MBN2876685.1 substrate-binding domain-containing protein [Bacilli bacterium]